MEFVLKRNSRDITDGELLNDMKRVASLLNQNYLSKSEYKKQGQFSPSTIDYRFNGWINACKKCGFEMHPQYREKVSDEEVLSDMISVARQLGKQNLKRDEYSQYGKHDAAKHFGSWNNALRKAGLDITLNRDITKEDLFNDLEAVWIKLGRQPTSTEIKAGVSKYGLTTYIRWFGRWSNALKEFVEYINNVEDEPLEGELPVQEDELEETAIKHRTKRDINLRMRFLVMKRDNFKCCLCGASPAKDPMVELQIDHIVPWAKGGETVIDNLQTLCSKCNQGKSDLSLD
nr:HNH endonuclease [uncultured Ruminococcus sp.]